MLVAQQHTLPDHDHQYPVARLDHDEVFDLVLHTLCRVSNGLHSSVHLWSPGRNREEFHQTMFQKKKPAKTKSTIRGRRGHSSQAETRY